MIYEESFHHNRNFLNEKDRKVFTAINIHVIYRMKHSERKFFIGSIVLLLILLNSLIGSLKTRGEKNRKERFRGI